MIQAACVSEASLTKNWQGEFPHVFVFKAYGEIRCKAPQVHNLDKRWGWVVSSPPPFHFTLEKIPITPWQEGWADTGGLLEAGEIKDKVTPLQARCDPECG